MFIDYGSLNKNIQTHILNRSHKKKTEREGGQWAVNYTSPKSFLIAFSYSLARHLWGLLI